MAQTIASTTQTRPSEQKKEEKEFWQFRGCLIKGCSWATIRKFWLLRSSSRTPLLFFVINQTRIFFLPSFPTSWVLKRAVKGHKTNILLFLLLRGILPSKYTLIHSMNHWNSDYCSRRRRWKDVLMLRKFFSPPQNISSIRAPALVKT